MTDHPGRAVARWQEAGVSVPTVSARWLVLRSALSWSVAEGMLRVSPVSGMRGPPRPEPRTHHAAAEVQTLLGAAGERVERASAALLVNPGSRRRQHALFVAEQTRLLVRLTADSAARRGELVGLRCSDLAGRVLTIERGLSHGVLGRPSCAGHAAHARRDHRSDGARSRRHLAGAL